MSVTTVFMSNRSQAVRLPKSVAFPNSVKQVEIVAVNNTRIISPLGHGWDAWFDGPNVTPDFMEERDQPQEQVRESF